jgi:hypothetical protein
MRYLLRCGISIALCLLGACFVGDQWIARWRLLFVFEPPKGQETSRGAAERPVRRELPK